MRRAIPLHTRDAGVLLRSPGCVYFVENTQTGRIKIGKADDVDKRLSGLQTGNDCELRLLGTIPGGVAVEEALHLRFMEHHVRGEWFAPAIRAAVIDLVSGEDHVDMRRLVFQRRREALLRKREEERAREERERERAAGPRPAWDRGGSITDRVKAFVKHARTVAPEVLP